MATAVKLPEIGESVQSAEIGEIYVKEGDEVEQDQDLLKLESEKTSMDLPSPYSGKVVGIKVAKGDEIKVGDTIMEIETAEDQESESDSAAATEDAAGKAQTSQAKAAEKQEDTAEAGAAEESTKDSEEGAESTDQEGAKTADKSAPDAAKKSAKSGEGRDQGAASPAEGQSAEEAGGDDTSRLTEDDEWAQEPEEAASTAGVTPLARRLARELNVNLDELQGSGQNQRIRIEDIVGAFAKNLGAVDEGGSYGKEDFARFGPVESISLNQIQKATARNMSYSWKTIPHVTHHDWAEITQLEKIRQDYLNHQPKQQGGDTVKITLTAILVRILANLLVHHERFNSSLAANQKNLFLKRYYHMGVAVDTDAGLLVPVVRDVDRKNILEISQDLHDLSSRARAGELSREDLEGASFTLTNVGALGGRSFTPIISDPQVAILGVAGIQRPLASNDDRIFLPLSLSYDHRVINGADAARFVSHLKELLSSPNDLFMEL
jgi:pyruvate dehydrogenase E2 component (dihydrolipoamide acetyltransferase)